MRSRHLFGALFLSAVLTVALGCTPDGARKDGALKKAASGDVEETASPVEPTEQPATDEPAAVAESEPSAVDEGPIAAVAEESSQAEDTPPAAVNPPEAGRQPGQEEPALAQEKPSPEDAAARAADEKANAAVVVDRAKGEVRMPCRFVNPTRQIEVFACHNMGPTHETVVEFDATGERLLDALQDIGCRSTSYWNGTSPGDFLRNQGDRVLVLVRWSHKGKEIELPAEAMLTDGETGFASFVRGFSFSAGPVDKARGGGAASRVTEITLGATQRERAVFSLLSHPTTLSGQGGAQGVAPCRALQPWSFAPLINTSLVGDLPELIESQAPAVIIFRRVKSESELLRYTRSIVSRRGVDDRLQLYESLEPIAGKIDSLKSSYEEIVAEIAELISLDISQLPEQCHEDFAARGGMLQALGAWYCSVLQHEYFRLYLMQEKFRLAWLRAQKPGKDDVEAYARVLRLAELRVESGLAYEVQIADQEARLASTRLHGESLSQAARLLELFRARELTGYQVKDMERRKAGLDASQDAYLLRLLGEEQRRINTFLTTLKARIELVESFEGELQSRTKETWTKDSTCIGLKRTLALETLFHSNLTSRLLSIDENIRWEEGDSDDGEEGVSEKEETAKGKLVKLQKERKSLEATASEAKGRLVKLAAKVQETCGD